MRVLPFWGNGQAQRWYLCFLGNVQHQLELLRHGQIFLCRFLQSKGRENFPLEFNSSEKLLTKQQECSQPQGSGGCCGPHTVRGLDAKTSAGLRVGRLQAGPHRRTDTVVVDHSPHSLSQLTPMVWPLRTAPTHSLKGCKFT